MVSSTYTSLNIPASYTSEEHSNTYNEDTDPCKTNHIYHGYLYWNAKMDILVLFLIDYQPPWD